MTAARRADLPTPEFHLSDDGRLFIMERFDMNRGAPPSSLFSEMGFEAHVRPAGAQRRQKYNSTYEKDRPGHRPLCIATTQGRGNENFLQIYCAVRQSC